MKVNIEIINKALIHDSLKIEGLQEKELVKKMILRRRLSRSSRILIQLAYQCDFTTGTMIYGSSYGEVTDTVSILESIKNDTVVSPTAFQNSVYNTAASYHSIVHGNTSEILTLSCGDTTSYNVMQQAALSLMSQEKVFVCVVESMNFNGVEDLNPCKSELEYGIAFTLKKTDKNPTAVIKNRAEEGVPKSLSWMKNLYDLCQEKESCIVEVEL